MDIGDLPDEDLRQQLLDFGVNVGPIVSSTRLFYEKKLGKLLESGGVRQAPESEESEEDAEEEEEEDEEVQINYRQTETRAQPEAKPKPVIKPQFTSTPITQTDYTPVTQARMATPTHAVRRNVPTHTETRRQPTTTTAPEKQEGGGGFSMLLKLLFVAFVAFLVYLVIINMNPSAQDKIPLTFDENQV